MKPLLLSLSFFFLFTTQVALAQNEVPNPQNERITQDGFIVEKFGFIPCNGPDCSTCHLVALVNTMVKWLIGIVFIFFAIIAVYAGFEMVMSGGNSGALSDAKSKFTNAFIGLFIVLAAWLMVDTLMRGLLNGSNGTVKNYGPWSNVQCVGQYVPVTIEHPEDPGPPPAVPNPTPNVGGANCPAALPTEVVSVPSSMISGDPEKIRPDILTKFTAMREAALAEGIDLKITDGWRPESEQVALWNRYCSSGTCGATKVARPCTLGGGGSNHNSGRAVDISVGCGNGNASCNTPAYRWLKANGGRFGFNNNLPTDPLHWSPSGR